MHDIYIAKLIASLPQFFKGWMITLEVTAACLTLSTLFGFILGVARSSRIPVIKYLIGAYVDIIRGTPFLVQLFIIFFILPEWGINLEAFASAILSLTIYGTAYICEIVHSGISSIPHGQTEAAVSTGLSWLQVMRHIILPQAFRPILPPLVGQFVLLIKDTAVVSVIGLTDVTRVGWFTVQRIPDGILVFGLVGIFYFVTCYPLIWLAGRFEKRLTVESSRM